MRPEDFSPVVLLMRDYPVQPPVLSPLFATPAEIAIPSGAYVALNDLVTVTQELQALLGLDAEDLVIFLTVLTGNLQRWHRAGGRDDDRVTLDPDLDLVPTTQSAIARATGIARETVRRRLQSLQRRALVRLNGAGAATAHPACISQIMASPLLQRRRFLTGAPVGDTAQQDLI